MSEHSNFPYRGIEALISDHAVRKARALALSAMGANITYAALEEQSRCFALWLKEQGLRPGDRVIISLPNVLANPVATLGAMRGGFVAVCINPLYSAAELKRIFADCTPRIAVAFETAAHAMQEAMPGSSVEKLVIVRPGDHLGLRGPVVNLVVKHKRKLIPAYDRRAVVGWMRVLRKPAGKARLDPVDPEQNALMLYSGGTTGIPKGVPTTQGALIAIIEHQHAWARQYLDPNEAYTVFLAAPLYHILGFGSILYALFRAGKSVLSLNPRNRDAVVGEWRRHRVTAFPAVNTLFAALLEHEGFRKLDFRGLSFVIGSGMPVQTGTAARWHQVTGSHITEAYGMTETALITANPIGQPSPAGSIGSAYPGMTISLRDDEERPVPDGQPGEICVTGRTVMKGYWNNPEETARAYTADGFLKTGDVAIASEDGTYRLVDRKKDMIIAAGLKIFPTEIEEVLRQIPGIADCVLVGAPDPRAGETAVLYVQKRDPSLSEEDIRSFAEENLANYKRPREIVFIDDLPKSPVGKILRNELRKRHA